MVKLLDKLLPEGTVFQSEDYAGKTQTDTSDSACIELPMVVLVNRDSYSAAEFFAAALQEYDWAKVVGERPAARAISRPASRFPTARISIFPSANITPRREGA